MNKMTSKKAAAAVIAAFVMQIFSSLSTAVSAESSLSAFEITEKMGVGWNLGNSLDLHIEGKSWESIYQYETQWGNPVVTESLIKAVQAKGFNTVRIPVT